MRWWSRLTPMRRVLLIVILVALAGTVGSSIWGYPFWPFSLVGFVAVVVNFALVVRDGLNAPIPNSPRQQIDRTSDTP